MRCLQNGETEAMADCVCLPKCLFFNDKMARMPTTAEHMKQRFCLGDPTSCARYKIFLALGREQVPPDLYPNNVQRAETILAAA
jgi:hypothetical protein